MRARNLRSLCAPPAAAGFLAAVLPLAGCGGAAPEPSSASGVEEGSSGHGSSQEADLTVDDRGACLASANSWQGVRQWASSLRLPSVQAMHPPSVSVFESEPVAVGEGTAKALLQIVVYKDGAISMARELVFVESKGSLSGCVTREHRIDNPPEGLGRKGTTSIALKAETLDHGLVRFETTIDGAWRRDDSFERVCRFGGDTTGCITIERPSAYGARPHVRVRPYGLAFRPDERPTWYRLELPAWDTLIVQDVQSELVRGRSMLHEEAFATARKASPTSSELVPMDSLDDIVGSFQDHGLCVSGVSDWDTVLMWVGSFRDPELQGEEVERWVFVGDGLGGGPLDAMPVAQHVDMRLDRFVRQFLFVKTNDTFAGCLVTEDHLAYGYQEEPTPQAGSLRESGPKTFRYDAEHEWFTATGEQERAQWQIRCVLDEGRLGCVAFSTQWIEQRWNKEREEVEVYEGEADWRFADGRLVWTHAEDQHELDLKPNAVGAIDSYGLREAVKARATLEKKP